MENTLQCELVFQYHTMTLKLKTRKIRTYESVKNCLKFEITTYRTPTTVARRFRLASPLFLFLHLLR
jgi:hypothetical protein